ncbi:MAG: DNA polymerase III subunit delta [Chloroflexi bacterium]|nr:MAG: DNA polymerase III subunit delta [Chloroflexota bacterium]
MYYIFHGDDEFTRSEAVAELKAKLGDPAVADINTTVLDGRNVTLSELIHACDSIPFMGNRRLVIVENMLQRFDPRKGGRSETDDQLLDALKSYLPQLPESTRLVFVESKSLHGNNPILKLAQRDDQAYVREFEVPRHGAVGRWITRRVKEKGGTIQSGAVMLLTLYGGEDLRLLDQEIEKLLTFAGDRAITEADVRRLVPAAVESNIFAMVDALGQRDRRQAVTRLHELLEAGESPIYLLFMITRQFRILTQVKELAGQGLQLPAIQSRLGLHRYVVEKALGQARNFSLGQLNVIYRKILETDEAIKTGQLEPELALDMLVAELVM